MRPKQPETTESGDLFRARLDQIIDMRHELVRLAEQIDWDWIDEQVADRFSDKGRPGTETRFMVGLLLLKHIYHLSDVAVRRRRQRQRGWKPYSLHAPEVECIGPFDRLRVRGKGSKALRVRGQGLDRHHQRPLARRPFVLHAKALPGNPYDGHTLGPVIEETQALTSGEIKRVYVDKGYRGHDAPNPFRVYRSGRKRGVHGVIRKELWRRSAIEAVIGPLKTDGHLGRNDLKGRHGDQANAVLTAVGHNLRLVLWWVRALLSKILAAILAALMPISALKTAS